MNGEQLSAELTRHGLDEIEGARKRLLGDLALEHFAALAGASRRWRSGSRDGSRCSASTPTMAVATR